MFARRHRWSLWRIPDHRWTFPDGGQRHCGRPHTIAFFTPLLTTLPNAALGAIIIVAVIGLVDVAEMRHIVAVKGSDLVGLSVASMLVVFARMSMPHTAVLGHVDGTASYRNVARFPEAPRRPGGELR